MKKLLPIYSKKTFLTLGNNVLNYVRQNEEMFNLIIIHCKFLINKK